jgi:hypothetical protein
MIDRFVAAVQRGIAGVIGILILFALLVGLVMWAKNDPDALQALVSKLVQAVVSLISWLCDLIVRALDQGGD